MKDLHKRLVDTINSLPGIDLNGNNLSLYIKYQY